MTVLAGVILGIEKKSRRLEMIFTLFLHSFSRTPQIDQALIAGLALFRNSGGTLMSTIQLFVGNLPFSVSHETLMDLFSSFKPISVGFVHGRNFAYVEIPQVEVQAALMNLDGFHMGSHELQVKRADYLEPRTALVC